MKATTITITGKVQGVGFRYSARAKANDLKVTGWVTNRPDGSVRAFVQGDDDSVDRFIEWLRSGPAGATVTGLDVSDDTVDDGLSRFESR